MRLIDADKLIDNLDNMIPATDDGDYAMGIAAAIQEVGRMACEDYVDAIPTEWIKKYIVDNTKTIDEALGFTVNYSTYPQQIAKMLNAWWEKENE